MLGIPRHAHPTKSHHQRSTRLSVLSMSEVSKSTSNVSRPGKCHSNPRSFSSKSSCHSRQLTLGKFINIPSGGTSHMLTTRRIRLISWLFVHLPCVMVTPPEVAEVVKRETRLSTIEESDGLFCISPCRHTKLQRSNSLSGFYICQIERYSGH